MALKKELELSNWGFTLPEAYLRVCKVTDSREVSGSHITIELEVFSSETARKEDKSPVVKMGVFTCSEKDDAKDYNTYFTLPIQSKAETNSISQSYSWLKTRPEFQDCVDC